VRCCRTCGGQENPPRNAGGRRRGRASRETLESEEPHGGQQGCVTATTRQTAFATQQTCKRRTPHDNTGVRPPASQLSGAASIQPLKQKQVTKPHRTRHMPSQISARATKMPSKNVLECAPRFQKGLYLLSQALTVARTVASQQATTRRNKTSTNKGGTNTERPCRPPSQSNHPQFYGSAGRQSIPKSIPKSAQNPPRPLRAGGLPRNIRAGRALRTSGHGGAGPPDSLCAPGFEPGISRRLGVPAPNSRRAPSRTSRRRRWSGYRTAYTRTARRRPNCPQPRPQARSR